jgi:cytosine/adenosine deaminase-related metal-dependent hydrolase
VFYCPVEVCSLAVVNCFNLWFLLFLQHIAEIQYENQLVMRTKEIDHGTVTYLEKIDFLRSNLLAAHSVWLNEPEVSKVLHNRILLLH